MTRIDSIWWEDSPFVWVEEVLLDYNLSPPEINALDTLMDDLLPHIRNEGEMLETDLSPMGMTEWIPGVDPVSELIEESILPPLPPAVTTLMKSYQRGEEQLPSGSGHVNIMIDLSGSMGSGIGTDSSGQDQTVMNAAQALSRIAVNACKQGGHSFAIFTFGSGGGDGQGGRCGSSTRQIWGNTLEEAKDYEGYLATLKSNGVGFVGDWSCMGGTNSGYGADRLYYYMANDVGSQIPDVNAATAFFITDAYWGDISVPGLDPYAGDCLTDEIDIDDIQSAEGGGGSAAFWYWAKKYHDDFGPFVLFKINESADHNTPECYRRAFKQYVGSGKKGYDKCVFDSAVSVATLPIVAKRMVQFINSMSSPTGEVECGGKGVTF